MKFVMIVCYETDLAKVVEGLEGAGATSYTFLTRIFGRGTTGKHFNTAASLGHNAAVLVGCEPEIAVAVQRKLRELQRRLKPRREAGGLHAFCWEADQWL